MMNVLIIEDEIKTARELKRLVEALRPGITVLDILPSVKAGIKWFGEHSAPDLIFSDIQLADGLSFDIYRNIPVHAPVVFCTAFDEYAIRAFEANGIDYLLKPVDEARLQQSLEKYERLKHRFAQEKPDYEKRLEDLFARLKGSYKSTLLVHFQESIIPVKTADIAFVYYDNGAVSICTLAGKKHGISATLEELESMLDPRLFFRANRQFIIHRAAITSVEHYFSRRLVVKLAVSTPEAIVVSKMRSGELLRWMES